MHFFFKCFLVLSVILPYLFCSKNNHSKAKNLQSSSELVNTSIELSSFGKSFDQGELSISTAWNIFEKNLSSITSGFKKVLADYETFFQRVNPENTKNANDQKLETKEKLKIYMNLLQFKLMAQTLMNQNLDLKVQIPNMRLLQCLLTRFWRSISKFSLTHMQGFKEALITRLTGYEQPSYEMETALGFEKLLNEWVSTIDSTLAELNEDVPFPIKMDRDYSVLLQRVIIGNVALYFIQSKSKMRNFWKTSLEVPGDIHANVMKDDSTAILFSLPGEEYILDKMRNINVSATFVSFYINYHLDSIKTINFKTATRTIKSLFCKDLKNFQETGNPNSIVSRPLLLVLNSHKNSGSAVDFLLQTAAIIYDNIDNLMYQEKRQKFVEKGAISVEEKPYVSTRYNRKKAAIAQNGQSLKVKKSEKTMKMMAKQKNSTPKNSNSKKEFKQPKKTINQKTKTKKVPISLNSDETKDTRVAQKREIKHDLIDERKDAVISKVSITDKSVLENPSSNLRKAGQFCYNHVLYPLLEQLNIQVYTWKLVSETCFTPVGLEALASLHMTQSQVDVCIAIVRDRVPFAHPSNLSADVVADSFASLFRQHPEMRGHIELVQRATLPNSSMDFQSEDGSNSSEDRDTIDQAALIVGEHCWREVFEHAASSLGLDTETSSIRDIIDQSVANNLDTKLLVACQSLIRLRNAYAHQGVSPADARKALLMIYGEEDEMKRISVLEPIFDRVEKSRSEGMEFY